MENSTAVIVDLMTNISGFLVHQDTEWNLPLKLDALIVRIENSMIKHEIKTGDDFVLLPKKFGWKKNTKNENELKYNIRPKWETKPDLELH